MARFRFARRLLLVTVLALGIPQFFFGQSVEGLPAFEIVSIKPANPQGAEASISRSGTGLSIIGFTPRMLVEWAYDVRADRLLGKSKWLDSARYDLVAQTQELPRFGELQLMMQALLNARFGLVIHREQRILPFFGLIVDKGGPKMRLSDAEPGPAKNTFSMSRAGRLSGTKVTTAMLANVPSNQVGQSVQDFTGLKGIFDFTLVWAPDGAPPTEVLNALSSLVTAVREQLGLKLESRRGPVDVIVVDRLAASPEAN